MASNSQIEQRKQEAYKIKKRNQRRANSKVRPSTLKKIILTIVCVVLILGIGCGVFFNSGLARRTISALTIGDQKISAAEYSYYYNSSFTSYYQTMASYFGEQYVGIDTTKSLKDQEYGDDETYADYFSEDAINSLQFVAALSAEAEKAGFTLTEDDQKQYDDQLAQIESAAESAGQSLDKYIQTLCGNGYTYEMYKNILYKELLAYDYRQSVQDGFSYTDADLEAYYEENKDTYDKVDYRYVSFLTQEATDDQEEVTLEQAKAEAEAFMDGITNEVQFASKSLARAQELNGEDATDSSLRSDVTRTSADSTDTNLGAWLFDASRKAGDLELIERANGDGYYVVYMVSPAARDEYHTANVRHILVQVTDEVTDQEAREKAEEIFSEWQQGDMTEDSFAALANQYSDDTGSNTNGGLYEDIYPGEMVNAFDNWVFNMTHEHGDAGIIETEYGYHIMYYVSENETEKWAEDVESALRSEDYNNWYDEILTNYEVKEHKLGESLRTEPLPVSQ